MKKAAGCALTAVGIVFLLPASFAIVTGAMFERDNYVGVPAWLVFLLGVGFFGLGSFLLGKNQQRVRKDGSAQRESYGSEDR